MEQQINFHKRQFKAYLALRGIMKSQVARKIGMNYVYFKSKSNASQRIYENAKGQNLKHHAFTLDECLQIIDALGISPKWQRRIFSKVLVK